MTIVSGRRKRRAITVLLVAATILVPTGVANAYSYYQGWAVNLPFAQQAISGGNQYKTTTASGNIAVSSVALNYTLNATMCELAGPCGTERFGLGDGAAATLPTGNGAVSAGSTAWLRLINSTWTAVRVSANGSWRSN